MRYNRFNTQRLKDISLSIKKIMNNPEKYKNADGLLEILTKEYFIIENKI